MIERWLEMPLPCRTEREMTWRDRLIGGRAAQELANIQCGHKQLR